MKPNIGLYLHIPFCRGKCPYCDFYSVAAKPEIMSRYTEAILASMEAWSKKIQRRADTVYFGGGTPSALGGEGIKSLTLAARRLFDVPEGAEITCECNPSSASEEFFRDAAQGGVNRISLGLQSACDEERLALGRKSGRREVEKAITLARRYGIENISLDLMLGVPHQTLDSIKESVDFCASSGAKHISAYMLGIEEGTEFHRRRESLALPDEDEVGEMYLYACSLLEEKGFFQYEISNFSQKGAESRHNLKYWRCEEYLGIGPSAHSFIEGERFFYPRSLEDFMSGKEPAADGSGGDFEEYAMLAMRLKEGLSDAETLRRFGHPIPEEMKREAAELSRTGLLDFEGGRISLTAKGFLLSNQIIARLIFS